MSRYAVMKLFCDFAKERLVLYYTNDQNIARRTHYYWENNIIINKINSKYVLRSRNHDAAVIERRPRIVRRWNETRTGRTGRGRRTAEYVTEPVDARTSSTGNGPENLQCRAARRHERTTARLRVRPADHAETRMVVRRRARLLPRMGRHDTVRTCYGLGGVTEWEGGK